MKRLLFVLPLLGFIGVAIYFAVGLQRDPRKLESTLLSRPAPEFSLPGLRPNDAGLDKAALTQAPLDGKVRLVNFFASWCAPCRIEHDQLMTLSKEGVALVGVAYKDKPDASLAFLKSLGDPYRRAAQDLDGRVAIDWGVYGVPETYIVDAAGVVRHRHVGPIAPEDLEKTIRPLIKELSK